jgi:hypothetical protein
MQQWKKYVQQTAPCDAAVDIIFIDTNLTSSDLKQQAVRTQFFKTIFQRIPHLLRVISCPGLSNEHRLGLQMLITILGCLNL